MACKCATLPRGLRNVTVCQVQRILHAMERRPEQFHDGEQIAGTAYQVKALIGSGGMGSVYEVEHLELGRVFVLKALHHHLSSRSDLVGRMRNEWRALAKLNHPHIVQVTDAGQTSSGLPFYVMERLEGRTLGQILAESGRLSLRRASEIIIDVLKGLDAAHATGAIHRDIKPQNIFVLETGTTKLLDFGIAKLRDRAARVVTAGGISIGTPRYMAPEQAEGGKVDGRADIYAAALVLYECVLGRGPFAHIRDPNLLVMAHIGEEPERVDFLDPSVPPEMGDLLHRWLSKFPASRPATAGLAVTELESLMSLFPGDGERAEDVTLGGNYDASTVGGVELAAAVQSGPLSVETGIASGVAHSALLPASSEEAVRQAHAPLTPTATIEASVKVERRVPATLGWGTQVDETGVDDAGTSPVPPQRSSKTPPPISSSPPALLTRSVNSRSPRRKMAMVVATSLGSFLIAWLGVVLFSGPRSEQDSEAAGPEQKSASSNDAGRPLSPESRSSTTLPPEPDGQALIGRGALENEDGRAPADVSAEPLPPTLHAPPTSRRAQETVLPESNSEKSGSSVPGAPSIERSGPVEPSSSASRKTAKKPQQTAPPLPAKAFQEESGKDLPGSGLW